ncbi:hypothetical protein [Polluticoccus soli]|uniref:hypothetical protein n=1 Tax=Polluticoccus soli TaxID=3034150 RepID=UPI0023E1667B|nr:hypothetical protein [Flavipsychrobacter sp. JY13-12]
MSVILLAISGSMLNFRGRDKASKMIVFLLALTFVAESAAYVAAEKFHTNMFVYHIFAPIQLLMLGRYFDTAVFKQRKVGLITSVLGIVVAAFNTIFLQPIQTLNSNFLLFEGLVIMAMALYAFQKILANERLDIYKHEHFWLILLLVFFWSMTYTVWALYAILGMKKIFLMHFISIMILIVNIITYFGIGLVLLIFPKRELKRVR